MKIKDEKEKFPLKLIQFINLTSKVAVHLNQSTTRFKQIIQLMKRAA